MEKRRELQVSEILVCFLYFRNRWMNVFILVREAYGNDEHHVTAPRGIQVVSEMAITSD